MIIKQVSLSLIIITLNLKENTQHKKIKLIIWEELRKIKK